MSNKIEFDYSGTMKYIAELEELAGELEKEMIDNTETYLNDLRSNWQGENADGYYSKLTLFNENNRSYIKNIKRIIETVRENANALNRAENESVTIIKG